uniref:Uncharacterized protein n=1 Tax=Candidatus Kentrum sp. MB TaxID=2138164 RepID=A0A450XLG5_9GAMM|nr:MAG: hypothetical protein BECKMB1821G_GA0114241_105923 [Candidatus Kentron sp. MB]VFK35182.1 MAG: hypothetical protein BECKMB1821I_GA0114274_110312 [Candidatus Kentron sp. MB]VFK77113.1 MAG: hypothetical protein BECKMB1821H_GA0114242_110012 [Candidatus Kentron sp. MB]
MTSPVHHQSIGIPDFRADGYLPEGVYPASESEVTFRFGTANCQCRRLVLRVKRWIELAHRINAPRLFIGGRFVTAKAEPNDVDAVILLPSDFGDRIAAGSDAAIELEEMLLTKRPEEIFVAEDETDWNEWVEFFSRTRQPDSCRKGLVEITL